MPKSLDGPVEVSALALVAEFDNDGPCWFHNPSIWSNIEGRCSPLVLESALNIERQALLRNKPNARLTTRCFPLTPVTEPQVACQGFRPSHSICIQHCRSKFLA